MKLAFIAFIVILFPFFGQSQNEHLLDAEPYFIAVIVNNMDTSIAWYADKLGFEIINRMDSEARGFKQANLKRGDMLLELIETNNTVRQEDIISNKPGKVRVAGFFKFGLLVNDFDRWEAYFSEAGIELMGSVVKDPDSGKRMVLIKDPDGNRIQFFEK